MSYFDECIIHDIFLASHQVYGLLGCDTVRSEREEAVIYKKLFLKFKKNRKA